MTEVPALAEFRLLGAFEVWVGGHRLQLGGCRQKKVLATLLLNVNAVVTTERLVDLLWEDPPGTARRQVHNAIARLRVSLGSARALVVSDGPGYRVQVAPEQVDVHRFTRALTAARRAAANGDWGSVSRTVPDALRLWRGPALAGLSGRLLEAAAHRLDEQRLAAQELAVESRLEEGEAASLIPELTELIAEHPLREGLRAQLILALARSGRQSEALEVYERTRLLLAEELGLEPGPGMRELQQRILRGDASLRGDGPAVPPARVLFEVPAPVEKDTATEDVPAGTVSVATPPRPCLLPYDIADFTGRDEDIARLLAAAGAPTESATVVTAIDGMAGVGKTALAVRVAYLLADRYPDGQLFIDLQGHTLGRRPLDPAAALDFLLRSLGVPADQVPATLPDRIARWRSQVAGRRLLLVLDNAEDTAQVRALMPTGPDIGVLVTGRRRLCALEGVSSHSLQPMSPGDATALFRRVAGWERTAPEPRGVVDVAELCGHLPLAVRIAASRFRNRPAWTVRHLVDRLGGAGRQLAELSLGDLSVANVFAASYDRLTVEQQRSFRLLGTHPDPEYNVTRAATLLGMNPESAERVLEELLDVHLLIQDKVGRYRLHPLLREYARSMGGDEAAA
ncbi:DNA-binding SARP family transcriptional activator [Actinophytocola algeriensis]|uniref:DNA-binding SARP family transcriptional activator n=1 Tax=Actinophytocola algeriensis TaxID=1768010 RepID=A0A7W7VIT5_9PSEU|nr:DNA-binding SARP family transcriptional activator [Actinophytocola algeriensis]